MKKRNIGWLDAFEEAVRTNPCGTVLVEGADGNPKTEPRPFTKKNAWAIEGLSKDGATWDFLTFFNTDKSGRALRFTHTIKWCMDKVRSERDAFVKGTFDKCRVRLHNLVSDEIIMVAILV
jgi:hypothetical protein